MSVKVTSEKKELGSILKCQCRNKSPTCADCSALLIEACLLTYLLTKLDASHFIQLNFVSQNELCTMAIAWVTAWFGVRQQSFENKTQM